MKLIMENGDGTQFIAWDSELDGGSIVAAYDEVQGMGYTDYQGRVYRGAFVESFGWIKPFAAWYRDNYLKSVHLPR